MDNQAHYRIHISKLNEVYLKIECDNPGICYELVQYFTFEVPGHKFMPAYRNKMWDGKIRLFSDKTGKIFVGLLDYIKEFCDRNEIDYDIDDDYMIFHDDDYMMMIICYPMMMIIWMKKQLMYLLLYNLLKDSQGQCYDKHFY